jgi:hypothetical protein
VLGSLLRSRSQHAPALPRADADAPDRPCVVHLVRAANGQAPFRAFLDAWSRCPPGRDCELVLAMKGFAEPREAEPYLELARGLSPQALFFSDEGLDLTVYIAAAATLRRGRYCFVNSFAEPLVAGWLARLDSALAQPGVGMVAATGSCASTRSLKMHLLRLPSPYRGVLPEPRAAAAQFMALQGETSPDSGPRNRLHRLRAILDTIYEIPERTLPYESFPEYHLRTNAFMIQHALLAELELPSVRVKHDAHLLENGRNSVTRQVQRRGIRTLVVDRDGVAYDHQQWHRSRTFWQGDQEGLLVADNQTRVYAEADAQRRRLLSGFAWGRDADPSVP